MREYDGWTYTNLPKRGDWDTPEYRMFTCEDNAAQSAWSDFFYNRITRAQLEDALGTEVTDSHVEALRVGFEISDAVWTCRPKGYARRPY